MSPYSTSPVIVYIVETKNQQNIKTSMTEKQIEILRRNVDGILMSIVKGPDVRTQTKLCLWLRCNKKRFKLSKRKSEMVIERPDKAMLKDKLTERQLVVNKTLHTKQINE